MLLTVGELREQVTTALPDDAVQRLLDAAEADITRWTWPLGSTVRELVHGSRFLALDHRAETIVAITPVPGSSSSSAPPDPLDPLTYALTAGGYVVAFTSYTYGYDYTVEYQPIDNAAERKRVQVAIVKDDVAYEGMQGQSLGDWSGTFGSTSLTDRRLGHLSSLVEPGMAVIG